MSQSTQFGESHLLGVNPGWYAVFFTLLSLLSCLSFSWFATPYLLIPKLYLHLKERYKWAPCIVYLVQFLAGGLSLAALVLLCLLTSNARGGYVATNLFLLGCAF